MKRSRTARLFADLAAWVAKITGRPLAFSLAFVFVLLWASAGPVFHLSDTWQLVMNTMSSVVTFLMVFLIQNAQARESEAIQAKLDAIIAATSRADGRTIGIERLPDEEIESFRQDHGPRPPADFS